MKRLIAALALLASCEPFPNEYSSDMSEPRGGFEKWRQAILAGKAQEAVTLMSGSLRSQWVYDRLTEKDAAAVIWKSKLQGTARTDLELWYPEAAKDLSAGRVTALPSTVLGDPSLNILLMGYLKDAQADVARDFREIQVQNVSADGVGVSVLIRNRMGEPEIYSMVIEDGVWKVDGHRRK